MSADEPGSLAGGAAAVAPGPVDPRRVDPALRRRYDVRGPRYTSYPPAPHFAEVDPGELHRRWRARNGLEPDPGLALYVHVPFCRSRCLFCGCHTYGLRRPERVDAYLDAVIAEAELAADIVDPTRPVRQVALGGGTPNALTADQIRRLMTGLEGIWSLEPGGERSVEIEPRSATADRLDAFLDHGFQRFSLGIQDFDEGVLANVRRDQRLVQVEDVVAALRGRGVDQINFDLIYGLPGQTRATAASTLERVLELRPDRIALYSYAHVPWMRRHQRALEGLGLPAPDDKIELFLLTARGLVDGGYVAVGMDHFARPGDPLVRALRDGTLRRTFMGYTTGRGLDTLGLGASAISWIGASYSQDVKELDPYLEAVARGRLPLLRGHLLTRDDEIRRELLLELFCTLRADLDALGRRFGIDAAAYLAADLERLGPMVDDGLVRWTPRAIEITELGRLFVRNVCMVFDRYLEGDPARRRYSRTV